MPRTKKVKEPKKEAVYIQDPVYKPRVDAILKEHKLDFTIVKSNLTGTLDGEPVITPYFGLFNSKSKECINTVKSGYGVSQNWMLVETILKGAEKFSSDIEVGKAGALHGGRQVYIHMKIKGWGHVGKSQIVRYITFIDSNDGSTSLSCGIGDLDMSCKNQFYYFYKTGQAKFRHTATIEDKIQRIPQLIEVALEQSMRQIKRYNTFLNHEIKPDLQHNLVHTLLGYDRVLTPKEKFEALSTKSINRMDGLYKHIQKETESKGWNLWGLHSGVTSWTTHELKGPKRKEGNGAEESLLIGTSYKSNIGSFKFMANKAGLQKELA
jgi:hypothetical protein